MRCAKECTNGVPKLKLKEVKKVLSALQRKGRRDINMYRRRGLRLWEKESKGECRKVWSCESEGKASKGFEGCGKRKHTGNAKLGGVYESVKTWSVVLTCASYVLFFERTTHAPTLHALPSTTVCMVTKIHSSIHQRRFC